MAIFPEENKNMGQNPTTENFENTSCALGSNTCSEGWLIRTNLLLLIRQSFQSRKLSMLGPLYMSFSSLFFYLCFIWHPCELIHELDNFTTICPNAFMLIWPTVFNYPLNLECVATSISGVPLVFLYCCLYNIYRTPD